MAINYSFINGFKYLSGTTAERPANPVAGSTYFNTTVGATRCDHFSLTMLSLSLHDKIGQVPK